MRLAIIFLVAGFLLLVLSRQSIFVPVSGNISLSYQVSSLDFFVTQVRVMPHADAVNVRFAEVVYGRQVVFGVLYDSPFDVYASRGERWILDASAERGSLEVSSLHFVLFLPGLLFFFTGLVIALFRGIRGKR